MMMNRYLLPMLVIAVSMGVYFLYIDKTYKRIAEHLAREQALEGFLIDAQSARGKLDKVIADYRSFPESADEKLRVLLPDQADQAKLIADINAIAESHGLSLRSPDVSLGKQNPDMPTEYLGHTMRIKIVATYPIFRDFIEDIERSLAIRDIDVISFKSANAESAETGIIVPPDLMVFEYNIVLKTYSLN